MTQVPPDKAALVELARDDLAMRLGVDAAQIVLRSTTDITWADISAGCSPAPGQVLTKGRVYGYRVWLQANGAEYIYHVGESGVLIQCRQPAPGANNPLLVTPGAPTQDPFNYQP